MNKLIYMISSSILLTLGFSLVNASFYTEDLSDKGITILKTTSNNYYSAEKAAQVYKRENPFNSHDLYKHSDFFQRDKSTKEGRYKGRVYVSSSNIPARFEEQQVPYIKYRTNENREELKQEIRSTQFRRNLFTANGFTFRSSREREIKSN